jgi:hypothetical protein
MVRYCARRRGGAHNVRLQTTAMNRAGPVGRADGPVINFSWDAMNIYFMLGSLAGNILDIAGVGGLLSGLLLRRFQFTLLGCLAAALLDAGALALISPRNNHMEESFGSALVASLLVGSIAFAVRMFVRRKKSHPAGTLSDTTSEQRVP